MVSFSLFNLNIMHGRNRKSAIFPIRLSRHEIQSNLQEIIDCIREHDPDIVALQEVDRSSVFSGSFNQFDFLDVHLKYPYKYFSPSCSIAFGDKKIFVSGNAIFSRHPLRNCESYKFSFSFPTDRMGFIVADAELPQGRIVTIASVHLVWLDWTRFNSRSRQLDLVQKVVVARKNSAVISGDFNCDFLGKEKSLRTFVNNLGLHAFEPENRNLNTNPSWNPVKRSDWILSSRELDFVSYKTIPDKISDHLAVYAGLSI